MSTETKIKVTVPDVTYLSIAGFIMGRNATAVIRPFTFSIATNGNRGITYHFESLSDIIALENRTFTFSIGGYSDLIFLFYNNQYGGNSGLIISKE